MRILRTVSFRVFAGTLFLLVASVGLFSYLVVRSYTGRLMDQGIQSAYRVSDFIAASTRYSMLLNRKQDVYQAMRTLGSQQGIEGIRIYNKRGAITFSTEPGERGQMVNLQAEACYACHDQARPLEALPQQNRARVYRTADGGHRVVGVITPVRNAAGCAASGCHPAPDERTVLGVLDVRMSLAHVDQAIAETRRRTLGWALAALVAVGAVSGAFLQWSLRRPIRELTEGTRALASGDLSHRIRVHSSDDLGRLAGSFNDMTRSLREAQEENRSWARTLEERVQAKTEELQRINRHITQIEKMASLGTLAASVAHELNNPLSGILTYARLDAKRLKRADAGPPLLQEVIADLEMIARESDRCGAIVKNLLVFSRQQEGGEFRPVLLREIIDRSLRLVAHHLQMARAEVESRCEPEDVSVIGHDGQLEQALVALLLNAAEAMPGGGNLGVSARREPTGAVRLAVQDTGSGIAAEDLPHIFEPFYTTKPQGKGVGLGLSVVYGIVQGHGATIDVDSAPGRGTTFTITFPAASRTAPPGAAPSKPADTPPQGV
jgi:two-component system NtrC family sensor kinase